MKVLVAKFFSNGINCSVREWDIEDKKPITMWKKQGFLVKEQIGTYRPGFYTTKKQFLATPGKNF
jgi:hypothetical protein